MPADPDRRRRLKRAGVAAAVLFVGVVGRAVVVGGRARDIVIAIVLAVVIFGSGLLYATFTDR